MAMDGGKDWSKIDVIKLSPNAMLPEHVKKSGSTAGSGPVPQKWVRDAWAFAMEDTNRLAFSLKVGVAMLLVSLLNLMTQPFKVFGNTIVLAILTVGIMIEYTVGATLNRGFNRAVGSLLAGIFAITVIAISTKSGHVAEPYVVAFSIFLVGTVTSFMKLWPSFVPYDYGFRVILFAYCLIIVSGYREGGDEIRSATDRLYSIAIGGVIAVSVNLFVCPVWAGEQLHKELVNSFYSVADSLEECVKKYLSDEGSEQLPEFSRAMIADFPDEPAFRKCMATLNSSARIDSLAGFARWEPPHGRFRYFFHPWSEYVNVAAVLRHCAYEVMALHGCLHSEIQAPYNLRVAFQTEILEATVQASELVRSLAGDISDMKRSTQRSLLRRLHSSTNRLQRSIQTHSYLLTSSNSMITSCYCPPSKPPSNCKFMDVLSLPLKGASDLLDKLQPRAEETSETGWSYHETMRKQQRRLYSWPSKAVDDEFEEDENAQAPVTVPRMRALESTAALSLATFASLLIEFIARLDHLVDAVDELAIIARFEKEASS